LEEGGRLGLKYLLLSYFRVGDHPEVALNSVCDHAQRRVSIRKVR
jgi:hypothetical protein